MHVCRITEEYVYAAASVEAASLDTAWSASQIREAMHREDTIYLIALEGGVVCAVASCVFSAFEAMIENVAVLPEYRRRGIAAAMLDRIEAEAKGRALENISLEVASRNSGAVLLYEKAGFIRAGVRKGFYRKQNDDAIVMIKELRQ